MQEKGQRQAKRLASWKPRMIVLFTDFGIHGPYTGQMKAVLHAAAPGVPVVDLLCDAPAFDPRRSAYLLAAYAQPFPPQTVFLAVVDPGVGGGRTPCVVHADDRWFVGPDNGLFELVIRRAMAPVSCWEIDWRPQRLSNTFHGRDLFAPVAARVALGQLPPGAALPLNSLRRHMWPDDLAEIIYVDSYGNAVSGLRAASVPPQAAIVAAGMTFSFARTFVEVPKDHPFWYENADGLVEIAVNSGRAVDLFPLAPGTRLLIQR
jgi:S-adenosylmethionine hydrolase